MEQTRTRHPSPHLQHEAHILHLTTETQHSSIHIIQSSAELCPIYNQNTYTVGINDNYKLLGFNDLFGNVVVQKKGALVNTSDSKVNLGIYK